MTTTNPVPAETAAGITGASLVDWSAIIVGALIATAFFILLMMFGAAIGLTVTSPWSGEGWNASTLGLAGAIWFALIHIYSIGMGAYMASRMRPRIRVSDRDEIRFRDGMTGLAVWALAFVLSFWIGSSVVTGTARLAGSTAATIGQGAASVGQGVGSGMSAAYQTPAIRNTLEATADQIYRAASNAVSAAETGAQGSRQAAAPAQNRADTGPAADVSSQDRNRIVQAIIARLADGDLSEADQQYLARLVADQTGMSASEVQERIATAAQTSVQNVKAVIDEAREWTATIAFWTVFIALISALAGWWAGAMGGQHRDSM